MQQSEWRRTPWFHNAIKTSKTTASTSKNATNDPVKLIPVDTNNNQADMLTKNLERIKFNKFATETTIT